MESTHRFPQPLEIAPRFPHSTQADDGYTLSKTVKIIVAERKKYLTRNNHLRSFSAGCPPWPAYMDAGRRFLPGSRLPPPTASHGRMAKNPDPIEHAGFHQPCLKGAGQR